MKIMLRLFFVFVFAFLFRSVNSMAFAGGDGTLANPYQISTKAHLMDIGVGGSLSASYILINDIVISGSNWDPIGTDSLYFNGTFDGNDYTISGLTIDQTFDMHGGDNKYIGLFGFISDGSVTDLDLTEVDINVQMNESNAMVGALAGQAYASSFGPTISNVTVSGTVMVRYYATEVSAHTMYISTGGLLGSYFAAGDTQISLLNNITSTADVSIGAESVVAGDMFYVYSGGIVGSAYDTGLVYCDYYGGEVNAVLYGMVDPTEITFVTYVGGLAGDISDNFVDKFIILEWSDVGKDGFDTTINGSNYVGGLVGRMDASSISDAQNCSVTDLSIYGESYVGGFAGTIAGYRFMASTATDITIYPTGLNARTNFGGAFGYIDDGYVYDLTLGNIRIEGFAGNVGGVSGYSSNTDYDTVLVNSVYIDSDSYVGGLIGYMIDSAYIRYSFVQGNIDAHFAAGGLVGWGDANGGSIHIDKSGFYGDISVDQDEGINGFIAGGILGVAADGSIDLNQVSSLGSITGGNSLGGLIGEIDTAGVEIYYAYSRMALNCSPMIYSDPEIGGLVGSLYSANLYVSQAYYAGVIDAEGASSDYVDPFMGYNDGSDISSQYSYYDDTLYTYDNLYAFAVAKTTAQMKTQAGYPNFDFADIWFVVSTYNDGYAQFDYGMNRINLFDGDTLVDVLLYIDDTTVDTGDVEDYVKAGYTFDGWYTDEALSTAFNEVTLNEGDVNLYAKTTSQIPDTSDSAGLSQMLLGFGGLMIIVSRKRKENLI